MILTTLADSAPYEALGSRIAAGLGWLRSMDPTIEDGRHPIDAVLRGFLLVEHEVQHFERDIRIVVGDPLERLRQPGVRIDVVHFGRCQKAGDCRP